MTSYTDGEGYTTVYEYDENGNLFRITDPRNHSRTAVYDALNRITSTTNEEGGVVSYTYDALGQVTQAVNEDGAVTSYTYDAKGRVTEIKDAYGHSRYIEYDPMDRITADTDENGVRRTYKYDKKGNLIKYTDGLGNSETYAYDKNGNQTRKTDRNGNTYSYAYDALNRPVSETDPKGNIKSFAYDGNGNIAAVTDKNGNTTGYTLDGNGNIVTVTDAAGTESHYAYDAMDRLTKVSMHRVDKGSKVDEWQDTLYTYDHRGLVKVEVNAKGDGKYFVYDENGNLISKTDEDGYVTEYSYSPVNLVSAINYSNKKQAAYLYNGTGELVEMTDWNGTTTFERDLLNRITEVTDHNGRTVGYEWDNVGNQLSLAYPDGTKTINVFDAENRLLSVTDFRGKTTEFTYDANGNQTSKKYANGEMEKLQYDAVGQLTRKDEFDTRGIQRTVTLHTYDAEGNRTSIGEYKPQKPQGDYQCSEDGKWSRTQKKVLYTYDELNRLVKEYDDVSKLSTSYAYDTLGNLTVEKGSKDTVQYTYNELNQLVSKKDAEGTTRYTYDKRGNRVRDKLSNWLYSRCTDYEYDSTNHLSKGTTSANVTSGYTWNGLGLRVNNTQTDQKQALVDRDYVIDYTSYGHNDLAVYAEGYYEYGLTRGALYGQKNIYAGTGRIELYYQQYNDIHENGEKKFLFYTHGDIMGSTVRYTLEDGSAYEEHVYDVWGEVKESRGYLNDNKTTVIEPSFTGHTYDSVLGIYFADARFYDAGNRQWMAMDPIKDGGNWYQYCYSNPLRYWDLLGLEGFESYGCDNENNEENTLHWYNAGLSSAFYQYELNGGDMDALNYFFMAWAGSQEVITLGNWVTLYNAPTVALLGRIVSYPKNLNGKYINSNSILGWYSQEGSPNKYANIPGMRLEGNTYMANGNRYVIALGPEVMLPGYPLNGKVDSAEFSYGTNVDVVIEDDGGNTYFIPCVLGDVKTHTYPNGIYQTGEAYPNAYGHPADSPSDANGSMVEFVTKESLTVLKDYSLKEVIVYD